MPAMCCLRHIPFLGRIPSRWPQPAQVSRLAARAASLLLLAAPRGAAWDGFQWETWREITAASRPAIDSPQAGLPTLLPLLASAETGGPPITTIRLWEAKRDRILTTFRELLGEPEQTPEIPPCWELIEEEDCGTYHRRRLRIAADVRDWIPAFLLAPKTAAAMRQPAVIVLHQTVPQGKDEPCGIRGSPDLAFAAELAERGLLCLVPDAIGFGERIPPGGQPYDGAHDFYRRHPRWSFFGKMIADFRRLVDYLCAQRFVDAYRIGVLGHSHGAYGAAVCAAYEPRVLAVVASCGFTTLRSDPQPERWSHLTALLPRLGFYRGHIAEAPFDWHEILACLAPRPLFLWTARDDEVFPNTEDFADIHAQLRDVYALYGAADSLRAQLAPGPHRFPAGARAEAYDWLDRQLAPRPVAAAPACVASPWSRREWEAARESVKELLVRDIGPVEPPVLPPAYRVEAEVECPGYLERRIRYRVAPDEEIAAFLLVPEPARPHAPGIIVFHQTTDRGKDEPAGRAGRESLHFGPELARRGYVVLAPDSICAGERIGLEGAFETSGFYRTHPALSALGKMIQDGRRAVDILEAVPGVDRLRIGAIGHSLGAEEALFVAAFDDRVAAAVASCGWAPLSVEADPERWARDHWFSYIPRWRIDLRAGRLPAWDFPAAIALIAPRGFFGYQTLGDEIFPQAAAAHPLTESLRPLWRLYERPDHLRSLLEAGPHDLSPAAKDAVYAWLDRLLEHTRGERTREHE